MKSFRSYSARFWILNLVLTLAIAVVHFCAYTTLRGMAFAAGDGRGTPPAWLSWPVIAIGFPIMPLGFHLLALLPPSIRGPLLGHNGMGLFYLLAGINALICGVWTTLQVRMVPSLVRVLRRTVTSRLPSLGA
jgi:hypothetical protein